MDGACWDTVGVIGVAAAELLLIMDAGEFIVLFCSLLGTTAGVMGNVMIGIELGRAGSGVGGW